MNALEFNKKFLSSISTDMVNAILSHIAERYGVTNEEIYEELTTDGCEHVLDYMVNPERLATSVVIQRVMPR